MSKAPRLRRRKRARSEEGRGGLEFRRVLFRSQWRGHEPAGEPPGTLEEVRGHLPGHRGCRRRQGSAGESARDRKRVVADWSSDVCSSDLNGVDTSQRANRLALLRKFGATCLDIGDVEGAKAPPEKAREIGRGSWRTGVQTCALPISMAWTRASGRTAWHS